MKKFLLSIFALMLAVFSVQAQDVVLDFTTNNFSYNLYSFPNLGYFGGAFEIINSLNPTDYDYTIISNVDVKYDTNAIAELINFPNNKKTAWIAPKIYSLLKNKDNPRK